MTNACSQSKKTLNRKHRSGKTQEVCLFVRLMYVLTCVTGDLEKVSELISGLALGPEEESPYEALFEATSCHSLDSLTSGKSSDRDSGRPDSEAGKVSSSLTETHPHPHT